MSEQPHPQNVPRDVWEDAERRAEAVDAPELGERELNAQQAALIGDRDLHDEYPARGGVELPEEA